MEAEDRYDMGMHGVIFLWEKYRPIIEENRRRYNGQNYLRDFEYFVGEMLRLDSLPESYIPPKELAELREDPRAHKWFNLK